MAKTIEERRAENRAAFDRDYVAMMNRLEQIKQRLDEHNRLNPPAL